MFRQWIVAVVVAVVLGLVAAGPAPGSLPPRVLLLAEVSVESQYSQFIAGLQRNGFQIDSALFDDKISLMHDGEWAYCGVLLFSGTKQSIGTVKTQLLDFVDRGNGSVLLAAEPGFPADFALAASKLAGVRLLAAHPKHRVLDHSAFHPVLGRDNHDFIVPGGVTSAARISAGVDPAGLAFRGVAAQLSTTNELVEPILWGSPTAYTADLSEPLSDKGEKPLAGAGAVLASALQTRQGARVVFVGSSEMFANSVRDTAGPAQAKFTDQLASWTFGHIGHLRAFAPRHYLVADGSTSQTYRSKDILKFEIDVEEWDGSAASWVPYEADDIQLEFTMMDPYQRSRLVSEGDGKFTSLVHVPDVLGIFKFSIEYIRVGVSHLLIAETVAVRPYNHNEFERFIVQAYPYYASTFSMLVGVLLFGLVMFYGQNTAPKVKVQ